PPLGALAGVGALPFGPSLALLAGLGTALGGLPALPRLLHRQRLLGDGRQRLARRLGELVVALHVQPRLDGTQRDRLLVLDAVLVPLVVVRVHPVLLSAPPLRPGRLGFGLA